MERRRSSAEELDSLLAALEDYQSARLRYRAARDTDGERCTLDAAVAAYHKLIDTGLAIRLRRQKARTI